MVTIRDIADAVGVSQGTVSRVLNGDDSLSVSREKRLAILQAAKTMNYQTPRSRYRSRQVEGPVLSTGSSQMARSVSVLHFLNPDQELFDPYYVGVRLGIERRCRELGLEIGRIFTPAQPFVLPAETEGHRFEFAGMIAIGRHREELLQSVLHHYSHVVFADARAHYPGYDSVVADLQAATFEILDGLWAAGYRKIGFIGSDEVIEGETENIKELRCRAYIEWMRAKSCFNPALLALGEGRAWGHNLRLEIGYEQAKRLLQRPDLPDAILAANDNMAIGAYRAIQEAGLIVPDDVAIASFNDIPVTEFLNPRLSTMHIPGEEIGMAAVDLLAERLAGRSYVKRVTIPTRMAWRDSCRRPDLREIPD